ncbi:MAG: hypothetical protein E7178_03095 [Erysipelotrichaceae bacterium]|jgi:hypothetical protein|nr:hypothetical protein [Erysipelotrichaceae bacterium]
MNKDELLNKLKLADEEIYLSYGPQEKIDIVIAGGSSLLIRGLLSRQTADIDVINFYNEIEHIFNMYDINSRILTFGDSLAENYEDRLEELDIETKAVNYKMLSLEDLVIMKLHSFRGKDYEDITSKAVVDKLNWNKLNEIIESGEADVSFNERHYKEFLDRYERYKKDCGKQ